MDVRRGTRPKILPDALGAAAAKDLFTIIDGAPRQGGVRRHACELVIRGSSVR
jgi:hypothetical protein